ncbi:hypothetical protein SBF1_5390004 [Candidatus Desulfosporosinus infrequens]|uniref:Uncharacterized protein n=1 Tax=Candidatus Desulfosporosinus infrequens TaxID=2043169 RepID=A0A2U3LJ45_9FIRM|nr:hypothetical protein SBF1_5390004 [Candidatus Desulfosporosinus infrequens]
MFSINPVVNEAIYPSPSVINIVGLIIVIPLICYIRIY